MIFLPAGAGEITTHNAFDHQRLRFAHNHGTTSELLAKRPQLLGKGIEVGVNKVIVDLPKPVEPENRELIEDRAFFRDGIGKNNVIRRTSISRDKQQGVAEAEHFAY